MSDEKARFPPDIDKSRIFSEIHGQLKTMVDDWGDFIFDKLNALTIEDLNGLNLVKPNLQEGFKPHPEINDLMKSVGLEYISASVKRKIADIPFSFNIPLLNGDEPSYPLVCWYIILKRLSDEFFNKNPQTQKTFEDLPNKPLRYFAYADLDMMMQDNITTLFDIVALSCYGHLNDTNFVMNVMSFFNKDNKLQKLADTPLGVYAHMRSTGTCPVMISRKLNGDFEFNSKYLEFLQSTKSKLNKRDYPYHGGCAGFAAIPVFTSTSLSLLIKIMELTKDIDPNSN